LLTPRARQQRLRAIFDAADKNGDGVLLPLEFAKSLRSSSAVKLAKSLYQQLKLFSKVGTFSSFVLCNISVLLTLLHLSAG
jgi:hypothetical protein